MRGAIVKPNSRLGSNFEIEIYKFYERYIPPNKTPSIHIGFSVKFEGNHRSQLIETNVMELEKLQWVELDYRIRFNPRIAPSKISRILADQIRGVLTDLHKATEYHLDNIGFLKIGKDPLFCMGDKLIRSASISTAIEIKLLPMERSLDIDSQLSEKDAIVEMLNLISICPNPCRVILAQVLVYLMRQAYVDAGEEPSFCVFLQGATGTKKTTLSAFMTQIYNRKEGIKDPLRLNASVPAAVDILMEANDEVVVLDDLFPADSRQVCRKQEETLIEITRYIGDGTVPARMNGKKVRTGHPNCGVLFTGEYLIGEGSDAARMLPVEMAEIDGVKLKYFQDKPLIVSTFYYYFIVWFIDNYDDIVAFLGQWLNQYREVGLKVHGRLQNTHFFLNTAYFLFLQYCFEKSVISEKNVKLLGENFNELLTKLIKKQEQRVRQKDLGGSKCFLDCIRELYRNKSLIIADNIGMFSKKIHDGVIFKSYLCLRGRCFKKYFPQDALADIVNDLIANDALDCGKKCTAKQIHGLGGKRFYFIPIECLK